MRKSAILSGVLHVFIGATALLWLLWSFLPVAVGLKVAGTLLLVLLAGWLMWRVCRRRADVLSGMSVAALPELDSQGPIVLVCGDGLDTLFPEQPLRKTAQGCWLRVGDVAALADVIRAIQTQSPRLVGQLSVMYHCLPDGHQDEAVLRATVKALRQQINQMRELTGVPLPMVLSIRCSGPDTPWTIVRGDRAVVCTEDENVLPLQEWQQAAGNITLLPVLSQAFVFVREALLDELEKTDKFSPAVHPFAVLLRSGAPLSAVDSLWSGWLYKRTCLQFPQEPARAEHAGRFADHLLTLLSPFSVPVQGGRHTRSLLWLLLLCTLAAIGFSVGNNRHLIGQVGTDLQRWNAIPMDHYVPKAQSLAVLKQDALLLERWQRQGEPLRYGLGLYPGQRLWLALQQAIDTYIPPPPPPPPAAAPKTVRLDSLSLFDTGKYVLKPGSLKMLVSALVDIKAKPGWLIVVAGHTDITGDAQANQQLSFKRAETLRDWMLSTSDVSPTCFAVQGYGATRPIASNDTPEDRALNRRVEISLVPQANACQAAAHQPSSNE
ncbi:OmpA family protein [Buttiauxella noackiae]|uniref:OmpA family protein n=1 Tax=Buttiauxella noackiae TaxID=82992 RepID=UPI0028D1F55C|nr:OmpA family protein [Buttiauxella noackiae]